MMDRMPAVLDFEGSELQIGFDASARDDTSAAQVDDRPPRVSPDDVVGGVAVKDSISEDHVTPRITFSPKPLILAFG